MGTGKSKIDYKERDFTEQPLEEEEIDILLKALPKENIINSIKNDGREKILRSMSDQKVFNIRGDSIFDYYFTNNKQELKNCMRGHMNQDNTPCEDEKFKRMITTMPNLVLGPLEVKQTQWNTEKNTLQTQWDSDKQKWNTEKNTLQTQWDTEKQDLKKKISEENSGSKELQTKYKELKEKYKIADYNHKHYQTQWKIAFRKVDKARKEVVRNTQKLKLGRFLLEPDIYNQELKAKMSTESVRTFTKNGDVKIDFKKIMKHSWFENYFKEAHKNGKSYLRYFVKNMKNGKYKKVVEQFIKLKDDIIKKEKDLLPLYFLFVFLCMKVDESYQQKRIVANKDIWDKYNKSFFKGFGIYVTELEYAIRFVLFNSFRIALDYSLYNDSKGLDVFLKDVLNLMDEYLGENYIKYLKHFDVSTEFNWENEKEELQSQVTKGQNYFKKWNESIATHKKEKEELLSKHKKEKKILEDKLSEMDGVPKIITKGKTKKNVSELQCKVFAKCTGKKWAKSGNWSNDPTGCITSGKNVWYNKTSTSHDCGYRGYNCVQR